MVTGYPDIRVYRRNVRNHASYHCERTAATITAFVDLLVPSAGEKGALSAGEPVCGRLSRWLKGEEVRVYEAEDCLAAEPAEPPL
jgi:hypothetical protein